jgi:hypothetical protein
MLLTPPPEAGCAPTDAQLNECQQNHAIASWLGSLCTNSDYWLLVCLGLDKLSMRALNLHKSTKVIGPQAQSQFPVCTYNSAFAMPP